MAKRAQPQNFLYIPIALKFAALITLLVVVFMWWITLRAVQIAEVSQDNEVNKSGIKVVCALAGLILPEWLKEARFQGHLEDLLSRFLADTWNLGIRDALVYDSQGNLVATGRKEKVVWVSPGSRDIAFQPASAARVHIREFQYQGQPIRGFRRAIESAAMQAGEARCGAAEVLLSAEQIRLSREETRQQMLALSTAACLAAAVGSFLLAAFLTRPIRNLVKDLRQVSLGHLDHQSGVRSADEIGNLARTFNHMTANLRQAQEILIAQKAAEQDLALAKQIQEHLLPRDLPQLPGMDIAVFYQPARQVGGDYFDFIPIDGEHIGVVIADVSGKGIPGSLVMTMTRSLLRMAAKNSTSPARTLCEVHAELSPDLKPGMFVSLLYLVIHLPSLKMRLARAGHPGPLLFTARNGKMHSLSPQGIALGLNPGRPLGEEELEQQTLALQSGDILLLYTDGIVEEKDPRGEEYSTERLARMMVRHCRLNARDLTAEILRDLEAHCGGGGQADDRTMVVIKCKD